MANSDQVSRSVAFVPEPVVRQLLSSIAAIGDSCHDLAEKRYAVLTMLAEIIGADSGFWSWGRGRPASSAVTPVANIAFGFTDNQRAVVIEWGLSEHVDREFRKPIMARMGSSNRSTDVRSDLFTDQQWDAFPFMRRQLARGNWESWLHSVRYSDNDTWSNFFLLRNTGKGEFGRPEAEVVDVVHNSVGWLHSAAVEFLPPEAFLGLTPRQRTVMLLLLDGMSRKLIASQLKITEDTVSDHIKSIYTHFDVNSAGELAAQFLRNR